MNHNDTFFPQNDGRCSDIVFNHIACFRTEGFNDGTGTSTPTSVEAKIYEIFTQHNISAEQLIKLFLQTAILDAFLSQDFPLIFLEDPMPSLLNSLITSINEWKDIRPSTALDIMSMLLTKLEDALKDLLLQIEQDRNLYRDELAFAQREYFVAACRGFLASMRNHFQETHTIFSTSRDDMPFTHTLIDTYFKYLYTSYEHGRRWAMRFFEYSFLNYAQVNTECEIREDISGIRMQTVSDERRRYIQLTIPSNLNVEDFFKLPLYTFHEYISHLCASTYRRAEEGEIPMSQVVKSYESVPTQLDEGWMIHVAHKFLRQKMNTLLGLDRQHLQYLLELTVDDWMNNMHSPYAGKAHITLGQSGNRIATAFLRLLTDNVCADDERKAQELYYRISIDLIMQYPYADFRHLKFILAIEKLCKIDKKQSIQMIRNSLDGEGTYINIQRLWELIKTLHGSGFTR